MSKRWYDEHERDDPKRDDRGRFRKGSTGNPRGRPRRQRATPWSVEDCFAQAFAEEVTVSGPGGTQKMQIREALVTSTVREAINAKGRDKFFALDRLMKLKLLKPTLEEEEQQEEQEDEGYLTEEDKRMLERITREMNESFCCRCERPMF